MEDSISNSNKRERALTSNRLTIDVAREKISFFSECKRKREKERERKKDITDEVKHFTTFRRIIQNHHFEMAAVGKAKR